MTESGEYIVACNGLKLKEEKSNPRFIELEYHPGPSKNVNIALQKFVTSIYTTTKRVKDLLEITGYIFAADRESRRGKPNDVEYHSWSRSFHFHTKVRDLKFWNTEEVKKLLNDILCFITGDKEYKFTFYKGADDFPADLFDTEQLSLDVKKKISITLFSGGLDSLAGIIEKLETTKDELCLVSHQSGQPSVKKTQDDLFAAIDKLYPGRCKHYKYHCGLSHLKSIDETQRTRAFLFTSMAFAIANTYNQEKIYVFENGITSLNFAKTQDMMNGRASRTTHPKTIALLERLFTIMAGKPFKIEHPFLFKTKTEVLQVIKKYKKQRLLDSAVSCSSTRNKPAQYTHCGVCSQCIDRRFAVYAAEIEKFDENGIYDYDFLTEDLDKPVVIKSLTDYIRLAQSFADDNPDTFYINRADQIIEAEEYIDGKSEADRVGKMYNFAKKHAKDIETSIQRMESIYYKPFNKLRQNSFYNLILKKRTYQEDDPAESKTLQRIMLRNFIQNLYPKFFEKPDENVNAMAKKYIEKYHNELVGKERKQKKESIRVEIINIRDGKTQV